MIHNPMCAGAENIQAKAKEMVSQGHWLVTYVFEAEDSPSFAYTIGLHSHGLPEIIIFCLPMQAAHVIINNVARLMIENKKAFSSGSIIHSVANLPLAIADAQMGKEKFTFQATEFYETLSYQLQQLVIPDAQGKFSWDDGYDSERMKFQPKLYSVDVIGHKLLS